MIISEQTCWKCCSTGAKCLSTCVHRNPKWFRHMAVIAATAGLPHGAQVQHPTVPYTHRNCHSDSRAFCVVSCPELTRRYTVCSVCVLRRQFVGEPQHGILQDHPKVA